MPVCHVPNNSLPEVPGGVLTLEVKKFKNLENEKKVKNEDI